MRLSRPATAFLLSVGLWSAAALAQGGAAREPSVQERSSSGRADVQAYGDDGAAEVSTIPWMAIGLIAIIFAVATPFAIRAYKNTAAELSLGGADQGRGRHPPPPGE